jgi:hypothetical protein
MGKTINKHTFSKSGVLSTYSTSYPQSATIKKGSAPATSTLPRREFMLNGDEAI